MAYGNSVYTHMNILYSVVLTGKLQHNNYSK